MFAKASRTDVVTAVELAALKRDRARLQAARDELKHLAEVLQEREERVIERIEAGAAVDGPVSVIVRRRQNISWLTVVRRELGDAAVIRVKNTWPIVFFKELRLG